MLSILNILVWVVTHADTFSNLGKTSGWFELSLLASFCWVSDVMLFRDVPPLIPLLAAGYLMLIYGLLGLLERRKIWAVERSVPFDGLGCRPQSLRMIQNDLRLSFRCVCTIVCNRQNERRPSGWIKAWFCLLWPKLGRWTSRHLHGLLFWLALVRCC